MEFTTTTTQFVTVTLTRRAVDTVGLVLTLDSTQVSSTLDAPPPAMESFRGTRLQGTMSPQGRIYSFEPPAGVTDPTTVSLYRAFKHFLAPVPAEISQGTTWADSAIDSFERGHFNLKSSTVTTSKVTGDTTYLGQPAWRVERTGAITISGQGEGSNSGIRLAVDGTIRGTRYVSTSGVFLGATGTQTTHLAMTRPNAPGAQTAPIQESIKSTVAALPGPGSAGP